MYLSAERMALVNQTVKETFEQSSIAWQAIPQWDIGDPGQTFVQSDNVAGYITAPPAPPPPPPPVVPWLPPATPKPGPLGGDPVEVKSYYERFYVTLAQAIAPNPDALLNAVIARTTLVAKKVDAALAGLLAYYAEPEPGDIPKKVYDPNKLLSELIDARATAEYFGYRAPSCLFTDTIGLKALSQFVSGYSILSGLLEASSVNSVYRVDKIVASLAPNIVDLLKEIDVPKFLGDAGGLADAIKAAMEQVGGVGGVGGGAGVIDDDDDKGGKGKGGKGGKAKAEDADDAEEEPLGPPWGKIILLGRRQLIPQGGAHSASPGEEPVDLAVSIPPSIEIVGERPDGYIELAVRTRLAIRVKDEHGIIGVETP